MKKVVLFLFLSIFLCSCSSQTIEDDTFEFAQKQATNYIENYLGYQPESVYQLSKIDGEFYSAYCVYQVSKDNEPIFLIEFEYDTEIRYGGISYNYKDGYLYPTIKDKYFREYEKKEFLTTVELNSYMDYSEYSEVKIISSTQTQSDIDQYLTDALSNDSLLSNHQLPIDLYGPIKHLHVSTDSDSKQIILKETDRWEYILCSNGEPVSILNIVFAGDTLGYGIYDISEQYKTLFNSNTKFIILHEGSITYQQFIVEEDGTKECLRYDCTGFHPLYIDKALDSVLQFINELDEIQFIKTIK